MTVLVSLANLAAWLLRSRTGRTVGLLVLLVAAVLAWRAYERSDAVADDRAAQADRDRVAVEERDQTRDEIRRDTDADLVDRLAGPR